MILCWSRFKCILGTREPTHCQQCVCTSEVPTSMAYCSSSHGAHLHLQILSSPEHHGLAMDICGLTPCFKRWWPSMLMHPWCWPDSSCAYLDSDQQDWFRLVKTGCNSCTPSIIIWVGYGYWSKFFNRMSFWHGQYLILGSDPRTEVKRTREIMPTQCI